MNKRYAHYEDSVEAVDRHLTFFKRIPKQHRPKDIIRGARDEKWYSYEFVEGHTPRTQGEVNDVFQTAYRTIWHPHETMSTPSRESVDSYCDYFTGIASSLLLSGESSGSLELMAWWARDLIVNNIETLYVSEMVHGDLTMENVIIEPDGNVVFIDPGNSHGLNVIELDEAKIMQSTLLKWGLMNQSSGFFDIETPFDIRPAHVGFLVSHVIRLLNHPERHSSQLRQCAADALGSLFLKYNGGTNG